MAKGVFLNYQKHTQMFILPCLKNTSGLMLYALNLYLKLTIIDKIQSNKKAYTKELSYSAVATDIPANLAIILWRNQP